MYQELKWTGHCRGEIIDYGLKDAKNSHAVAISVLARVDEWWDADHECWVDCRQHDYRVRGDFWVIKKDGSVNSSQIEALVEVAGWDGNFITLTEKRWQPAPCQFFLGQEKNEQGQLIDRYRIAWVNHYDRVPGMMGNVDADKAKQLQAKFGAALRAHVGNAAHKQAPAAGKPAAPSAPRKSPNAPKVPYPDPNAALTDAGNDVPFDVPASDTNGF